MGSLSGPAAQKTRAKACSALRGATRLREMLKDPSKVVVCPGVYDGLSARVGLSVGFDALYMVSAEPCIFHARLTMPCVDRSGHFDVKTWLGRFRHGTPK